LAQRLPGVVELADREMASGDLDRDRRGLQGGGTIGRLDRLDVAGGVGEMAQDQGPARRTDLQGQGLDERQGGCGG
jgi:hypothetical protein